MSTKPLSEPKATKQAQSLKWADFQDRLERMESEVQSLKEVVNMKSEELDVRLRCLHEFQMSTNQRHFAHTGENKAELRSDYSLRKSSVFKG